MSRILICLDDKRNAALLRERLGSEHEVSPSDCPTGPDEPLDLGIFDGPALARLWPWARGLKRSAAPVFLPFLLVAARDPVDTQEWSPWEVIDNVIVTPITPAGLRTKVEVLLRTRRLSIDMNQRYQDLETFAYSVSHDLRAPLRTIRTVAEELAIGSISMLDAGGRRNVARILQAADRADNMVRDLLIYDRINQIDVQPAAVGLGPTVKEALIRLNGLIVSSKAEIDTVEPLGEVIGQPGLVTQILQNLLANAITYVAPGVRPHVRLWAESRGKTVRLWVQDNGIGIEPQYQEQIFGLFQRLHTPDVYPGTGIGLATVRRAAERLQGHVGVESEPGRGSRFWVEFNAALKNGGNLGGHSPAGGG
jgi:signal transduction histidine kinase